MNTFTKLLFAAASLAISLTASAQTVPAPLSTDLKAPVPYSAYVQDSRGIIARNPYGLCWRTGYWTPADAVQGCDLPLCVAPQVLKDGVCVTPPPVCVPPQVLENGVCVTPPAPPTEVAPPAPVPVSEKVTFSAQTLFDFDKAVLRKEGKAALDEMIAKMGDMNLEVMIAVGHTDSIGTDAYNQKLSIRRAEAVKKYLVSKGIATERVYTEGKGEKQPVATNKTRDGRQQNRRVTVEVVGTRTVMK